VVDPEDGPQRLHLPLSFMGLCFGWAGKNMNLLGRRVFLHEIKLVFVFLSETQSGWGYRSVVEALSLILSIGAGN
jgi:hypothetical protein